MHKLLLAAIVFTFSTVTATPLKWYSFHDGLAKAQQENKIILIDFYTDWCGWCKKMDGETYTDSKIVAQIESGFVPVKINPEKNESVIFNGQTITTGQLSQASGVTGFPAIVFYTPDMKLIELISGYQDVANFKQVLDFMLSDKYKQVGYYDYKLFKTLQDMDAGNPGNPDINYLLGFFYLRVFNDPGAATEKFKSALDNNSDMKEVYAGLYLAQSKLNNETDAQKWEEKAKAKGYTEEKEIDEKAIELAKKVFN
jgi:thioredoxin-related protein